MSVLTYIIAMFGTFIASIVIHEAGHIIYFKEVIKRDIRILFKKSKLYIFGLKTPIPFFRIQTGEAQDYDKMTAKQSFDACYYGIVAGIIPIIMMTLLYNQYILWLMPAYMYGCKKDFFIMYSLWKLNKHGSY